MLREVQVACGKRGAAVIFIGIELGREGNVMALERAGCGGVGNGLGHGVGKSGPWMVNGVELFESCAGDMRVYLRR